MKQITMLTALVGVVVFSLLWQGDTLARLLSQTEPIANVFEAPECSLTVTEEFDGTVKENVQLHASGDVAQYVRVQLIPTMQDEHGNTLAIPISLSDFTIEGFEASAWVYTGGYYYYKTPVQPNDVVLLFDRATVKTTFSVGQIPCLIIAAQGVQHTAAEEVWGVTLVKGTVTQGGQSE